MAIRLIDEEEHGLYIWLTDDNLRVADEEGRTLNIPAKKGDLEKIGQLRDAARYWGIQGGRPYFLSNKRQVTDEEYDYQMDRLKAGLVADPLDFHAMEEEAKYARRFGN